MDSIAVEANNLTQIESNKPLTSSFTKRWMSYIDGNKELSELTIPGTHDTGTWTFKLNIAAKCQEMDLTQQLEAGIRYLDIRLKRGKHADKDRVLWVFHGGSSADLSFSSKIMNVCFQFLQDNPSETILMSIKNESGPTDDRKKDLFYDDLMSNVNIGHFPGLFYTKNKIPTLSEVRGKIVLFRRFGMGSKSGTPIVSESGINMYDNFPHDKKEGFTNNDTSFYVQDAFDNWSAGKDHLTEKFTEWVKPTLALASGGGDYLKTLFLNFTSGSGGVYPKSMATGYLIPGFDGINKLLADHLAENNTPSRLGIVAMDFPETPNNLIKDLIERNLFKWIRHQETGWVGLIFEGQRHHVPNNLVAEGLFGKDYVKAIPHVNVLPPNEGVPLIDAKLIQFENNPKLYLSYREENEKKPIIRHISNPAAKAKYGLFGISKKAPGNEGDYLEKGSLEDGSSNWIRHQETGWVGLIFEGQRHHVPNNLVAEGLFGKDYVKAIPHVNVLPPNEGVPLIDAELIQFENNPKLYLSYREENEEKPIIRHISNPAVRHSYGLVGTIKKLPQVKKEDYLEKGSLIQ